MTPNFPGVPFPYFCSTTLSPASRLLLKVTISLPPLRLQPDSVGPVCAFFPSYTVLNAAVPSRSPTGFLDRGWMAPLSTTISLASQECNPDASDNVAAYMATGVSAAAAHAGAHLANCVGVHRGGGGGGVGPSLRMPPDVAHLL